MSLSLGSRLGPYEVVSALGAGGMGEVYRARDTRLGRDVAIKVLPAALAADPDRLRRFEQEARAIAALNHPHICQLHDVGPGYFVLEYVEGEPLHGPMAVDQAVRLALQMVSALERRTGAAFCTAKSIGGQKSESHMSEVFSIDTTDTIVSGPILAWIRRIK